MVKGQDEIKLKLCDASSTQSINQSINQSKHKRSCMFTVSNVDTTAIVFAYLSIYNVEYYNK